MMVSSAVLINKKTPGRSGSLILSVWRMHTVHFSLHRWRFWSESLPAWVSSRVGGWTFLLKVQRKVWLEGAFSPQRYFHGVASQWDWRRRGARYGQPGTGGDTKTAEGGHGERDQAVSMKMHVHRIFGEFFTRRKISCFKKPCWFNFGCM